LSIQQQQLEALAIHNSSNTSTTHAAQTMASVIDLLHVCMQVALWTATSSAFICSPHPGALNVHTMFMVVGRATGMIQNSSLTSAAASWHQTIPRMASPHDAHCINCCVLASLGAVWEPIT
jgi:hypothetical protein